MSLRQVVTVCQCAKMVKRMSCLGTESKKFHHCVASTGQTLTQVGALKSHRKRQTVIALSTEHQSIQHSSYTTMEEMYVGCNFMLLFLQIIFHFSIFNRRF